MECIDEDRTFPFLSFDINAGGSLRIVRRLAKESFTVSRTDRRCTGAS